MNTTSFQPNIPAQNPNYSQLNAQSGFISQQPNWMQQAMNPNQNSPFVQFGTTANTVPIQQPNALGQQVEQGAIQGAAQANGQQGGASALGQQGGAALGSLCAWIITYGNGGYMPWFVKPLRDIAYEREPEVQKGYAWTSKWLIPLMMFCPLIDKLVKELVVYPLTEHCGYIMSVKGCKPRIGYQRFWFGVWKFIGKFTKERN